jgi:hypothetical protein
MTGMGIRSMISPTSTQQTHHCLYGANVSASSWSWSGQRRSSSKCVRSPHHNKPFEMALFERDVIADTSALSLAVNASCPGQGMAADAVVVDAVDDDCCCRSDGSRVWQSQ